MFSYTTIFVGPINISLASLHRLRKAIAIRAYNVRSKNETLHDQFKLFSYRKAVSAAENTDNNSVVSSNSNGSNSSKDLFIALQDIKLCLKITDDGNWVDELYKNAFGVNHVSNEFVYNEFIDFIESGKVSSDNNNIGSNKLSKKKKLQQQVLEARSVSCDNTPRDVRIHTDRTGKLYSSASDPSFTSDIDSRSHDDECDYIVDDGDPVSALSNGLSIVTLNGKVRVGGGVIRPLWRKREVVRQERTVHYTTIDADGAMQELVEKETSQTEILHMECKDTGEFAHRETTNYEQFETFNDEVVAEQHGVEEYVHLKSQEDEFEYMESNMPKKDGAETEDPGSRSPRVGDNDGNQQQDYHNGDGSSIVRDDDLQGQTDRFGDMDDIEAYLAQYNTMHSAECAEDEDGYDVRANHNIHPPPSVTPLYPDMEKVKQAFDYNNLSEEEKDQLEIEMEKWHRQMKEQNQNVYDREDDQDAYAQENLDACVHDQDDGVEAVMETPLTIDPTNYDGTDINSPLSLSPPGTGLHPENQINPSRFEDIDE